MQRQPWRKHARPESFPLNFGEPEPSKHAAEKYCFEEFHLSNSLRRRCGCHWSRRGAASARQSRDLAIRAGWGTPPGSTGRAL